MRCGRFSCSSTSFPMSAGRSLKLTRYIGQTKHFFRTILVDTFRIDSLEVLGISSELLATAHPEEVRVLGVSIEAEVLHLAPLLLVLNGEKKRSPRTFA